MSLTPNPQHLQRQAYEQFRRELVQSETMYSLFWPSIGRAGIKEYTYLSIANGSSIWAGDACRMLQEVLGCSPGIANKLAWSLFVPEKAAKQRGGVAAYYEEDAICLCIDCTAWATSKGIPFSFNLTKVPPRVEEYVNKDDGIQR